MAVTLAAAVSPQASNAGWRVVTTVGPSPGVTFAGNLIPVGGNDAWSTWGDCGPCSPQQVTMFFADRWDGHAWRQVKIPSPLAGFQTSTMTVSASSRDAWLFNPAIRNRALYWDGQAWASRTLPTWVIRSNLTGDVNLATPDFGPGNLWVFSRYQMSFTPTVPFAARFDGRKWHKAQLPGIPLEVSAVSASDIWVLSFPASLKGGDFLAHWNGRSWSSLAIPKPRRIPPNATEDVRDLLATGPTDVWLQRDIQTGSGSGGTLYLLHWNGNVWQRVSFGVPTSLVDYLAQDGHGGIWLVANGPLPAFRLFFDHRSSSGQWSQQAVPASAGTHLPSIAAIGSIPGTQSMWATGSVVPVHSSTNILGAIWKFGS